MPDAYLVRAGACTDSRSKTGGMARPKRLQATRRAAPGVEGAQHNVYDHRSLRSHLQIRWTSTLLNSPVRFPLFLISMLRLEMPLTSSR